MAKSRFAGGAGLRMPPWPDMRLAGDSQALDVVAALNSVSDRLIVTGCVQWADGGSHDIHSIAFRVATAAPVATLRLSLRDVSTAAGPPARDDAGVDQSSTQANPASNTNYTLVLGADRVAVPCGTDLCLVWDFSAYTSGQVQIAGLRKVSESGLGGTLPQTTFYTGAVYEPVYTSNPGNVSVTPCFTLIAADGTLGTFYNCFPQMTAAVTQHNFASNTVTGSGGDERGLYFTVSQPMWANCMGFMVDSPTSSVADFSLVLYEDSTAKATVSIDGNQVEQIGDSLAWVHVCFPDVALTAGHTYRVVLKPTTTTAVNTYSYTFASQAALTLVSGLAAGYTQRTDAGSWTDTNTQLPVAYIGFCAVDDGAGGGGSTLILSPGLLGGVNA